MYHAIDFDDQWDRWTESRSGNFILREADGVRATVFQNDHAQWQIILNSEQGGLLVADEYFEAADSAIRRADKILAGAACKFARDTANVTTGWAKQAKALNGKPTYGRKYGSHSVTVRCAASGKWYYITYQATTHSEPQGWFDTAEHAMQAFDSRQ